MTLSIQDVTVKTTLIFPEMLEFPITIHVIQGSQPQFRSMSIAVFYDTQKRESRETLVEKLVPYMWKVYGTGMKEIMPKSSRDAGCMIFFLFLCTPTLNDQAHAIERILTRFDELLHTDTRP